MLWAAVRKGASLAGRHLVGLMLAGWGAFNLVEGIVDHQILTVHHVNPDNVILWTCPGSRQAAICPHPKPPSARAESDKSSSSTGSARGAQGDHELRGPVAGGQLARRRDEDPRGLVTTFAAIDLGTERC